MAPNNDDFNADELEAPQWMNSNFFTNVLRECEKDNKLQVTNVQITPATIKGDHYASVMFRASVRYIDHKQNQHVKSLIVKSMPEMAGAKKEHLEDSKVFETENGMYSETLPELERMLCDVGDQTRFAARCLYHSLSPKKLIIFEDLVEQGYCLIRNRQANVEESKFVLNKLAKMHATSYILLQKDPNHFNKYQHGLMTISAMVNDNFFTKGIDQFVEMLEVEPTLTKYKKYFDPLLEVIVSSSKDSYLEYFRNRQPNDAYVLCHGDFHCKNMMFKYDKETQAIENAMLCDFQISFVGPPALDLIYAVYMLFEGDLREQHWDELILSYYNCFADTLQKIGFKGRIPKLLDLRLQLVRHRYFEIFMMVTFLPMWYAFRQGKVDPGEMVESVEVRRNLYKNRDYIKDLETILPKYLYMGYLNN